MHKLFERLSLLPADERVYVLRSTVRGLFDCGDRHGACKRLTDAGFIAAKTIELGIEAILDDYELAREHRLNDAQVQALEQAIRQNTPLLARCATHGELLNTLLTHIAGVTDLAAWLETVYARADMPLMQAAFPLPDRPDRPMTSSISANEGWINETCLSPDGRHILLVNNDGMLKVWELEHGELVLALQAHASYAHTCAWSPDGSFLVTGSIDKKVKVWDFPSGNLRNTLAGHRKAINGCDISMDSALIATAADDKSVYLWECATGSVKHVLAHYGEVNGCAFSPDGVHVVTGGREGALRIWSVETGELVSATHAHSDSIYRCRFNHAGTQVASVSFDGTVRLWRFMHGHLIPWQTLRPNHTGFDDGVNDCTYSQDDELLAVGCMNGAVVIYRDDNEVLRLKADQIGISSVLIDTVNQRLLTSSTKGNLKLWHLPELDDQDDDDWDDDDQDDDDQDDDDQDDEHLASDLTRVVRACAFHLASNYLVTGHSSGFVILWNYETGKPVNIASDSQHAILDCDIDIHGRFAATSRDRCIYVWSPDGKIPVIIHTDRQFVALRALKRQIGDMLTTSSGLNRTNSTMFHEYSTQGIHHVCRLVNGADLVVSSTTWHPEGEYLWLWDLNTKSVTGLLTKPGMGAVNDLVPSIDGTLIVSVHATGQVEIWDLVEQRHMFSLESYSTSLNACGLALTQARLVAGADDGTVIVWDLPTSAPRYLLRGHRGAVVACSIDLDGQRCLSVGKDGTVRVWELEGGTNILTLYIDDALTSCAFHTNGEDFIVGGTRSLYFLRIVNGSLVVTHST